MPRAIVAHAAAALVAAALPSAVAQGGDEVPFVTTPDNVTLEMLRLADVGPRDHVIDLGSGDGRIVVTAARRFGASGLGVDLVADLVERSRAAARQAGVAHRTAFRVQDLFETDLSKATVVTMYLLPEVNLQLRPRLLALEPGTRIVSHDWDMGDWQPDRSVSVPAPDKSIGLDKRSTVHLWVVPARVQGLWCGTGGASLALTQRYQAVEARWQAFAGADGRRPAWALQGRLDGAAMRLWGAGGVSAEGRLDGDSLVVGSASAGIGTMRRHYTRATGDRCPD